MTPSLTLNLQEGLWTPSLEESTPSEGLTGQETLLGSGPLEVRMASILWDVCF